MKSPLVDPFRALIDARKSCRRCVQRHPGRIHAGALCDFDPDVVSYWSQWLGHPKPHLLIVGQDFGDVNYFRINKGHDEEGNETNINLLRLLRHIGLTPETSSRPVEFHHQPLTEPYLMVSHHTALHGDRVMLSRTQPLSVEVLRFLLVSQLTKTSHITMSSPSVPTHYRCFNPTIG